MTRKENLIYEMENLASMLNEYIQVLEKGKIDEMVYQRLDESMFSLTIALRLYFGEDPFAGKQITILEPDA